MTDAADAAESFWAYSLASYARVGAAEACLRLQDDHGLDVNVALWSLWIGETRGILTMADLDRAEAACAPWRSVVVAPLRTIRRALKDGVADWTTARVEDFRSQVKALELEAERRLQSRLAETPVDAAPPPGFAAAAANLRAYADAATRDPDGALDAANAVIFAVDERRTAAGRDA